MTLAAVRQSASRLSDVQFGRASFLISRAGLLILGIAAMGLLSPGPRRLDFLPGQEWLSMWAQWDAQHYIDIALTGYTYAPGQFTNIVFFPFFPLLMRVGAMLAGSMTPAAAALVGLVVNNVGLVAGLVYLVKLVGRDLSGGLARRSVVYVLLLPTTLYLSAVYAEGVFFAASVACFYYARRGEWYRSGICGAIAALTRPWGIVLVVPLAIELVRQRPALRRWPAIMLVPAALAVFVAYLWWLFGDPLVYVHASAVWGDRLGVPFEALPGYLNNTLQGFDWPYSWSDLISMAVIVVLAILSWRLLPVTYAAYATAGVLLLVSGGVAWFSTPRHALAFFPLIVTLAALGERSRVFNWLWLAFSIAIAALFMARFALGYWVT